MFKTIREDIQSVMERDPAARSKLEVGLLYPGFHAVLMHRLSHALWVRGWKLSARFFSTIARFFTGIEIHPGAVIGRRFVIDHGAGLVIGETSEIGNDVTLYHAVTLGGIAPAVDSSSQVNQKRHPTLEDGVIVGSGAQILGSITVGAGARVGANAVALHDIPPGVSVVGIPARVVVPRSVTKSSGFAAYGAPDCDAPDPMARAVDGLLEQVATMSARIEDLERQLKNKPAPIPPGQITSEDFNDDKTDDSVKGEKP